MRSFEASPAGDGHGSWTIILQNYKLALLLSACLFGLSVAIIEFLTPYYKAEVEILLPFASSEDPSDKVRQSAQSQTDSFVVRSYKSVVEDPGIDEQVIAQLHLDQKNEFQPKPSLLATAAASALSALGITQGPSISPVSPVDLRRGQILDIYKGRLTSKNDAKSLILDLSFMSEDPYLAKEIVNTHAAAFIDAEVKFRRREAQVRADWMKSELDGAAEEVRKAQVAIQLRQPELGLSRENSARQAADSRSAEIFAASKRAVYEEFLAKYRSMIAEQHYAGSGIRLLSEAVVPIRPAFPRKFLFGAAAAVLSVFLGFLTATLLAVVRKKETIVSFCKERHLALIGGLNLGSKNVMRWPGRAGRLARICFWDQVRLLRSALHLQSDNDSTPNGRVVVVTSAMHGEGKSVVSAALARSLASSGVRTLLIDFNIRKPSFYAPEDRASGLDTFLRGKSEFAQSISAADPQLPIYLMACASTGRKASIDAIASRRMRELLQLAREDFEAIVIDTPPIGVLADALFVAAIADEVVLTAMEDRTRLGELGQAIDLLLQREIAIRGVVLCRRRRPDALQLRRLQGYAECESLGVVWPNLPRKVLLRFFRPDRLRGNRLKPVPSVE